MTAELKELYTILLLGDGNVGKTSFADYSAYMDGATTIRSLNISEFIYSAVVKFETSVGSITINMLDCDECPSDDYIRKADAVIIMYDSGNPATRKSIYSLYWKIINSNTGRNIPIVVVGNKSDVLSMESTLVNNSTMTFAYPQDYEGIQDGTTVARDAQSVPHYLISIENEVNTETVLLELFRLFSDNPEVIMISSEDMDC